MLELRDVSLIKDGKSILRGVSWKLNDGENWVLFGRNGSGKTMLLEVISGYIFPSTGEVIRFGKRYFEADIRELRKKIGYVSTTLRNRFSGWERVLNVIVSGVYGSIGLLKSPQGDERARAIELLSMMGMEDFHDERFGPLSDGEKQKVLILRALISNPKLLLLDEPAMGLDIPSREDLLDFIGTITRENGANIIYVTHHTEEISSHFSHIFVLHEGSPYYTGALDDGFPEHVLKGIFSKNVSLLNIDGRYYTILNGDDK